MARLLGGVMLKKIAFSKNVTSVETMHLYYSRK